MKKALIYYAVIDKECNGDSFILNSNECLPKELCGDSDWYFNIKTKKFCRYYTFHHEIYGLQKEYEEIKGHLSIY
jgi:hypothetical protein